MLNLHNKQTGVAAILITILVLAIFFGVIISMSVLAVSQNKITHNIVKSSQAYLAAEAGVEDSIYRIIKGKNYLASNFLNVASSTVNVNISDVNNQKIIQVSGEQNNRFRNLEAKLTISTQAISFYYGVQVGEGGLTMDNNSQVQGSIYSNGSIQGGSGAIITGDAWVANTAANIDQQTTFTDSDFIFGKQGEQIDAGQSFTPSANDTLTQISLFLKKVGNPGDKTVRILTDNNGQPSKILVSTGAYGTLRASQVSQQNYGWLGISFNTPPMLQAGVKYWLVVDTSADNNNYFIWGKDAGDSYVPGTGQYSPNWNASSPLWYSAAGDLAFRAYLGGTANSLDSVTVGGNAHVHTISNCAITGDAFYQTISNSTVGGTQYPESPDPGMEQMPISDGNIADWKAQAEEGGSIGSYTLDNGAVGSLGPKKITGNLAISNNADLTITGTVYVAGNITIANGAKLRLGADYGSASGVVVTDGQISVSNNSVFYTNGDGSYLLMLSTKTGIAITVANNANTVIFYASGGSVSISNNAILREVTAYQISLSNGAQIIYESGLASAKFSSGGTGAAWAVEAWHEIP